MLAFCGMESCRIDGAGRVRLPQRIVDDFLRRGQGSVVLFGLPEGAVAVYPEDVYEEMRRRELGDLDAVGASFTARRSLRRFGSMACPSEIRCQGRLTLPEILQKFAGLTPGKAARIIGVEIGVEIWAADRFEAEMADINQQQQAERQAEIARNIKGEVGV